MRRLNRYYIVFLFIMFPSLLGGFLPTCSIVQAQAPPPKQEKPIVLRHAQYWPAGTSEGVAIRRWSNEIMKRTGNRVKIEHYFAEALVKATEQLTAIREGIVDFYTFIPGYFAADFPLTQGLDLIYLTTSNYVQAKAIMDLYRTYKPFREEFDRHNMILLAGNSASQMMAGAKVPIRNAKDFVGLKLRTFGITSKAIAMLGATSVAIPLPELYPALERGVVDGFCGVPFVMVYAFKIHEVCPYIVNPGMGAFAQGEVAINRDTWNKLPADIRKIIEEVSSLYTEFLCEEYTSIEKKAAEEMRAKRVDLYNLPSDEVQKCKDKILPKFHDDWIKSVEAKGLPGRELSERFKEIIKKWTPKDKYVAPF